MKRLRVSFFALGLAEEGARGQKGLLKNLLVKVRAGGRQRSEIHFAEVNLSDGHSGDNRRDSRTDEVTGVSTPWIFSAFFLGSDRRKHSPLSSDLRKKS